MVVEATWETCPGALGLLVLPLKTSTTTMDEKNPETNQDDEFASKRLTEEELKFLFQRIEREWPIRCKLAELAGFKANPKNPRALMDSAFDLTIRELYLEVMFRQPQNMDEALKVIRSMHAAEAAQWAAEEAAKKAAKEAKRKKK